MAYFNNAATTYPKPEIVYKRMDSFYRDFGFNPGRSNNTNKSSVNDIVLETREKIKKILRCKNKEVIFQPSATIAINLILNSLIKNNNLRTIYISPFEHNAILRLLNSLKRFIDLNIEELNFKKDSSVDLIEIEKQFVKEPPDLVVISHVSNVTGLILPVIDIFELAKKSNAITVLDMAQSAGLVDLDVGSLLIDFAVFAGHKTLYGPLGLSGLVMKPEILVEPLYYGGTGIDSANEFMPRELPLRLEAGSQNLPGIFGLNAALEWIEKQGIDNLLNKEQLNRKKILDIFNKYDFIHIVGNNPNNDYVGIVSCLFDNLSVDEAEKMLLKQNILIRSGLHCSPSAHKFLGTFPSGTLRFSSGYFNSEEDFEELENALDFIDMNF